MNVSRPITTIRPTRIAKLPPREALAAFAAAALFAGLVATGRTDTARTFGTILAELLALFVAVSFLVAIAQRFVGPQKLQRWLGGNRLAGMVKGIALGAATPFCSCSTIPVLAGLLRAGVPFATAAAFLIASPLVDPFVFAAVWLLFGLQTAIVFTIIGVVATLALALLWDVLGLQRFVKRFRVVGEQHEPEPWRGWRAEAPAAWRVALSDLRPVLVPLLVGVGVGAFIYGTVPQDLLTRLAGADNPLAVPAAALLSVPVYLRAETALPIGLGLLEKGMGLGAVFAFVIAGAGVSLPEISMLTGMFRKPLLAAFVASVLAVAIAGGYLIPLFS